MELGKCAAESRESTQPEKQLGKKGRLLKGTVKTYGCPGEEVQRFQK